MPPEPASPEPAIGRRLVIAAVAVVACLAPAACDAAAASPAGPRTTTTPTRTPAPDAARGHGGHPTATAAPTTEAGDSDGDDPADPAPTTSAAPTSATTPPSTPPTTPPATPPAGLDVLGRDCSTSKLPPHTGFQIAPACVTTEFGEVSAPDRNPSLLITKAPRTVAANVPFTISVSTRNLVRDRFLGAAAGGYYLESSFLDPNGLQRGHFHTACRILPTTDEAPDAAPVPAFFVATQDKGGGAEPDTVVVTVTGLPKGEAQCTVWAGDGSHRVPMMQRANQTPAIDSVRITVA